jgi:hypothetical protein
VGQRWADARAPVGFCSVRQQGALGQKFSPIGSDPPARRARAHARTPREQMGLAVAVGRRPTQRSGVSRSRCAGKRPTAAEPRHHRHRTEGRKERNPGGSRRYQRPDSDASRAGEADHTRTRTLSTALLRYAPSRPDRTGPTFLHLSARRRPTRMGAGTNNGLSNGAAAGQRADDGTTVFRGTAYSPLRTTVALALWLGAIHFNAFLVLASLFLFPRRVAALYAAPRLRPRRPPLRPPPPPPPGPPPPPPPGWCLVPRRLDRRDLFILALVGFVLAGCWRRSSSSCSCRSVIRADWAARSPGSPPPVE